MKANTKQEALIFIERIDKEQGVAWSEDIDQLAEMFVEYASSLNHPLLWERGENVQVTKQKGGNDKYFEDLEKWENSFYCNECGADKHTDFNYNRTVSNGEVWNCKHCKTEFLTGHIPKEDNY